MKGSRKMTQDVFSLLTKIFINILMLWGVVGILACANVIAVITNLNIAYITGVATGVIVTKFMKLIIKSIMEDLDEVRYMKKIEL